MTSETSSTPISILIKSLCEESTTTRNHLCSLLSKSDFKNIVVTDMCGSGNNKVRKDYLSKTIIALLEQIEVINKSLNTVFNCDTLSERLDNINCDLNSNQFQSDINTQLAASAAISDAVDKAMKQHSVDIEEKLSELLSTVSKLGVNVINNNDPPITSREHVPDITQDRWHVPVIEPPEPAFSDSRDDFLTLEEEGNLIKFLSNVDFAPENGHSVKNFGASYHYTGASDATEDNIPAELDVVVQKVKALYPDTSLNQCLVNCYKGNASKVPEHSDDEPSIDPESSIYCVSLGQDRTMIFRDKFSDHTTSLVAKGRSIYAMTRSSQTYYTHRIDEEPDTTLRYSITLRNVGQQFRKSTIIIGDSNSKYLMFGEGVGTFGKGQPGKRVKAAVVSEINPNDCAAYANAVTMVGTNNMRQKYISSKSF